MKSSFFLLVSVVPQLENKVLTSLQNVMDKFRRIGAGEYIFSDVVVSDHSSVFIFGDAYANNLREMSIDKLAETVGCFAAVECMSGARDKPEVRVTVDYFGFGVIYKYEASGLIFISNSLPSVVKAIRCYGDYEFNENAFRLLDYLSLPLIQQPIFDDLPIVGLSRLPPGFIYSVSEGRLTKEQSGISLSSCECELDYEQLLNFAKIEIANNIKFIDGKLGVSDVLEVDLSGGKDSRMLLAACLSVDGVREKLRLNTRDDPGANDLIIVCALAHQYNLKFNDNCSQKLYPIGRDECFDLWVRYYFSEYPRLSLPNLSARGENVLIALSGGGGEIVTKTANVEWIRKFATQLDEGRRDNFTMFLAALRHYSKLSSDFEDNAELTSSIRRQISIIGGDDADDFLNRFYLRFRNRVHFGMNFISVFHGRKLLFPLQSKYLYLASGKLSLEDRSSGRVIYDFIKSSKPELLSFPFASRFEYFDMKTAGRYKEISAELLDFACLKKNEWAAATLRLKNSRGRSVSMDLINEPANASKLGEDDFVNQIFIRVLTGIDKAIALGFGHLFNADALCKKIIFEFNSKISRGLHVSTYLLGLFEYLDGPGGEVNIKNSFLEKYQAAVLFNPICGVEVNRVVGGFIVRVMLDKKINNSKFAYYLYKDNVIAEKKWYRESREQLFLGELDDYSEVRVFCRKGFQTFSKLLSLK